MEVFRRLGWNLGFGLEKYLEFRRRVAWDLGKLATFLGEN